MNLVVDASVAIKWFFRLRDDEADVGSALLLLRAILAARHRLVVPAHFIAEVSAVLARETPGTAAASVATLVEIDMERLDGPAIMQRAVDLSVSLGHHLFDTLYHAVALDVDDALLVTADERYYRKAVGVGRIVRLSELAMV